VHVAFAIFCCVIVVADIICAINDNDDDDDDIHRYKPRQPSIIDLHNQLRLAARQNDKKKSHWHRRSGYDSTVAGLRAGVLLSGLRDTDGRNALRLGAER